MAAFATVERYRSAYDSAATDERVGAMLEMASRRIRSEMAGDGLTWEDPDEELAESLADVTCAMAHRALGEGRELPFGATAASQAAGPYSESVTLANPYGDLFMTKAEKGQLGIGVPAIGSISPFLPWDREAGDD